MSIKIFVFDWNGEDIRICSSTTDIPKKWYQITNDHVNCFKATFMKRIKILMSNCDVAVFSTQTNPNNDYFHEYILKNSLTELGYKVDTEESSNISLIDTKLKLSVCYKIGLEKFNKHGFIFKDNVVNVKIPIVLSEGFFAEKTYTEALAMYYTYKEETFVFIAVSFAHLHTINRKRIVRNQNDCLEYFIQKLIKEGHIDYGFICGDMNYQMNKNIIFSLLENVTKTSDFKDIIKYDELYPYLDEFNMNEGVNGQGPLFMPTYALKEGRSAECKEMNLRNNQNFNQRFNQNINQTFNQRFNVDDTQKLRNKIKVDVTNYVNQESYINKQKVFEHIKHLENYPRLKLLLERLTGIKKYQGDTPKELQSKINLELNNIKETQNIKDRQNIKSNIDKEDLNKIIKDNVKMYKVNRSTALKNLLKQNLQSLKSLNNRSYDRLVELLERLTAESLRGTDTIDNLINKIILMLTNMDKIYVDNKDNVKNEVKNEVKQVGKVKNVSECYKSTLAYHNRILNTVDIKCLTYDRIDIANNAHHSAVYGLYHI